jgi:hypothetical protein
VVSLNYFHILQGVILWRCPRLIGVRRVEIKYTGEVLLVFSLPDMWHVAPIVGAIFGVRRLRAVKYSWSARSIEHVGQVVDIGGGGGVVYCFTSGDSDGGEYNCGRNEHGKRKRRITKTLNTVLERALS